MPSPVALGRKMLRLSHRKLYGGQPRWMPTLWLTARVLAPKWRILLPFPLLFLRLLIGSFSAHPFS